MNILTLSFTSKAERQKKRAAAKGYSLYKVLRLYNFLLLIASEI